MDGPTLLRDLWLLIITMITYAILTILFHKGKYPPAIAPSRRPERESLEATGIAFTTLILYWCQTIYRQWLGWVISTVVYLGAGLCLLIVMEKVVGRRGISSAGFTPPTNRKALMIFTGVILLELVGGIYLRIMLGVGPPHLEVHLISRVIVGPFVEETIFRGLIQTRLEAGLGAVRAWVLTGLLFGFYHYWAHFLVRGRMLTPFLLTQLVAVSFLGMLFGVVFAKTRSLLPSFLLHAVNNLVGFIGWN